VGANGDEQDVHLNSFGKEIQSMAKSAGKAMSKSEIAATLAEKVGISKKQATLFMQAHAELAYKQAKNSFVIPGIGKLVLAESPAREMMMRFGPKAGQIVKVPKRKKVKFRVAKAAKDAILGAK
jgi:DNA-binding protein HU-beta